MRSSRPRVHLLLASVMVLELAAGPCLAQTDRSDPWERTNRKLFAIQDLLDRHIFGPLARGFGKTPSPVRIALRNLTRNLGEPLVFVNDMLQGHIGQAASTVGRFAINSTVGVAGLIDVAARGRIPHHDNGFGTTLGRWGVKPGPYVFLPLVGPSNVRDTFGSVANIFLNPLHYAQYEGKTAVGISTAVVGGLDTRAEADQQLQAIRAMSTDPYATLRSYYMQNRAAEIRGQPEEPGALPDIDTPPESSAPAGAPAVSQPQPAAPVPPLSGEAGALPHPETVSPPPEATPPGPAQPPPAPPAAAPAPAPAVAQPPAPAERQFR